MTYNTPGCLGFLLGFGSYKTPPAETKSTISGNEEGAAHSGPGGYEDMGYSGGYAADYFASEDNLEE